MTLSALAPAQTGFTASLTLDKFGLHPLRASGGVSPSMALGVMPTRPALLISLGDTAGCAGWGEVWANFPPRANMHKMHLIQDVVLPHLSGLSFCDPREVTAHLRSKLSVYFLHIGQREVFEHILAGIDMALWDLALRSAGRSFAEHVQGAHLAQSYASSLNRDDLETMLAKHGQSGQRFFKLKLGFGDEGDCAFVARAHGLLPDGRAADDRQQPVLGYRACRRDAETSGRLRPAFRRRADTRQPAACRMGEAGAGDDDPAGCG